MSYRKTPSNANPWPPTNEVGNETHHELRHRGEPLVRYRGPQLWKAVGGTNGVAWLIMDLYRRSASDEVLRHAFPHFQSGVAIPFFIQ